MENFIEFVKSKTTGGHYALKAKNSKKAFINPMDTCKSVSLKPDDIVVDIGAYVGEYSLYAIKQGVSRVIAYEPTPNTLKVLEMNKKNKMDIINRAVVGDDKKEVFLYLSKGIGVTNSIVKKKPNGIIIPTIKYEDAVKDATVVKIDVEGAEYSYNIIQPQLRAIILEFHPLVNQNWKIMAEKIIENIESSDFHRIKRPYFKHGWDYIGSWIK
jgi:FkbM family methyltransferase|tara:strand:- start:276 stop:914 length:639 start_codon:yes stop_codon:yes gene_type:complete